nr:MAG TPA: hypothetical protein [Caudoviricetes sp.]
MPAMLIYIQIVHYRKSSYLSDRVLYNSDR